MNECGRARLPLHGGGIEQHLPHRGVQEAHFSRGDDAAAPEVPLGLLAPGVKAALRFRRVDRAQGLARLPAEAMMFPAPLPVRIDGVERVGHRSVGVRLHIVHDLDPAGAHHPFEHQAGFVDPLEHILLLGEFLGRVQRGYALLHQITGRQARPVEHGDAENRVGLPELGRAHDFAFVHPRGRFDGIEERRDGAGRVELPAEARIPDERELGIRNHHVGEIEKMVVAAAADARRAGAVREDRGDQLIGVRIPLIPRGVQGRRIPSSRHRGAIVDGVTAASGPAGRKSR
jgi:hypothetical protein